MVDHLTKEVKVGNESIHEDDGHARDIKQTDRGWGVWGGLIVDQLEGYFDTLKVNGNKEDKHSTKNIAQVQQIFPKEHHWGSLACFFEEDVLEQSKNVSSCSSTSVFPVLFLKERGKKYFQTIASAMLIAMKLKWLSYQCSSPTQYVVKKDSDERDELVHYILTGLTIIHPPI